MSTLDFNPDPHALFATCRRVCQAVFDEETARERFFLVFELPQGEAPPLPAAPPCEIAAFACDAGGVVGDWGAHFLVDGADFDHCVCKLRFLTANNLIAPARAVSRETSAPGADIAARLDGLFQEDK